MSSCSSTLLQMTSKCLCSRLASRSPLLVTNHDALLAHVRGCAVRACPARTIVIITRDDACTAHHAPLLPTHATHPAMWQRTYKNTGRFWNERNSTTEQVDRLQFNSPWKNPRPPHPPTRNPKVPHTHSTPSQSAATPLQSSPPQQAEIHQHTSPHFPPQTHPPPTPANPTRNGRSQSP